MTHGSGGSATRPATAGHGRAARLIVLANVAAAVVLSGLSSAGLVGVTSPSAYLGAVFLVCALVPANLLRFERFARGRRVRTLARLRKPFGVSAGAWFVVHSVASVPERFDLSLPLGPQFARTGIVLGLVATAVFVAMLATSTDRAQRALGANWKRLHRLVWFAVPLSLAHVLLASGPASPSNLLFLGLVAFAGFEYRALRGSGARVGRTHLILVGAGTVAAALIYVVF